MGKKILCPHAVLRVAVVVAVAVHEGETAQGEEPVQQQGKGNEEQQGLGEAEVGVVAVQRSQPL